MIPDFGLGGEGEKKGSRVLCRKALDLAGAIVVQVLHNAE